MVGGLFDGSRRYDMLMVAIVLMMAKALWIL